MQLLIIAFDTQPSINLKKKLTKLEERTFLSNFLVYQTCIKKVVKVNQNFPLALTIIRLKNYII